MFTEDHSAFFETAGHATAATFTSGSMPSESVDGIYNDEYADGAGGMVEFEGSKPTFFCAAADVLGVVQGDKLRVEGQSHNVVNVRPDGTGQVILILEKFDALTGQYGLDFSNNYNSQYLSLL